MKLTSKIVIAFAMLAVATTSQAQLNLNDTNMATSDWSHDTHILQGSGSLGVTPSVNGNPGNAINLFNNIGNNSAIASVHLQNNAVMTVQSGGLSSLGMSIDALTPSFAMAVGFVIKQNGSYYVADYGTTPLNSWTTFSNASLLSTDFAQVTFSPGMSLTFNPLSNPDFNMVGSQLEFGFITANSGANSVTIQGVFDNFSVQAVPEPATLSLLALPVLAAWRKRHSA